MKVLTHIRDEAHRFGITHHRNKRSKETIRTELNDIPGIGESTVKKLFDRFPSVEAVKNASEEDLQNTVGAARARAILEFFRNRK